MDVQRRDFVLAGTLAAAAVATSAASAQTAPASAGPGETRGSSVLPGDEKVQYTGGTEVKRLKIVNTAELEVEAEKILPKGGYGYIFGGSGAEYTKRENLRAMVAIGLEPHFLAGVLKPDLSVTILGSKLPFPIIIPPMGSHGLAHVSKEIGTAQAAEATGALMVLSMQSNVSLEDVAAAHPGPKWMQLYFPADRGYAREVIMRAKAAGYSAIVPTINSTLAYPRDNNIRNNFRIPASLGKGNAPKNEPDPVKAAAIMSRRKVDLNWDDMVWVKEQTGLPVVVKGVMSPATARSGGRTWHRCGLGLESRRPCAGRRSGVGFGAAADCGRGEWPCTDCFRQRHPSWPGRVPGAGAGGRRGRLRAAGALRACARRTSRRPERARIPARRPLHRHATRRHGECEGDHPRLHFATPDRVKRAQWLCPGSRTDPPVAGRHDFACRRDCGRLCGDDRIPGWYRGANGQHAAAVGGTTGWPVQARADSMCRSSTPTVAAADWPKLGPGDCRR